MIDRDYETNKLVTTVNDLESQVNYLKSKVSQHQQQEQLTTEKDREMSFVSRDSPKKRSNRTTFNCESCLQLSDQF